MAIANLMTFSLLLEPSNRNLTVYDTRLSDAVMADDLLEFTYPPIPSSIKDKDVGHERELGPDEKYGVKYDKSQRWGIPEIAAIRATFEEMVMPDNEELIRSYHPSLSNQPFVEVIKEAETSIWRIFPTKNCKSLPTHIGGREAQVVPRFLTPRLAGGAWFDRATLPDPIGRRVNPRRCLSPGDLKTLRQHFPSAVGVRVLISHFALLLYPTVESIYNDWKAGVPASIGGLDVNYILSDYSPSNTALESGSAISTVPDNYANVAALGLKLRLPNGQECITTVSHSFFPHKSHLGMKQRLTYYTRKARAILAKFRPQLTPLHQPAQILHRTQGPGTPLGTSIWAAGTNRFVGVVGALYDNPSRYLLYPHGYRHDLALIQGLDLPDICPLPNVNIVSEWAPYEDALNGLPVFAAAFNAQFSRWGDLQGAIASKAVEKAVVQGMDYHWDKETKSSSAGLIWRTANDSLSATGWSGSVLCLGTPAEGRPLLFQNYEHPIYSWPDGEGPEKRTPIDTIKGGFFLPIYVRSGKILLGPSASRRDVVSELPAFRGS